MTPLLSIFIFKDIDLATTLLFLMSFLHPLSSVYIGCFLCLSLLLYHGVANLHYLNMTHSWGDI
jgi:hypothetical protein